MNVQDARYAIEDQEFFWLENIMLAGSGSLRSIPGKSTTAFYTATGARTILSFFFYNIGSTNYCAVFFTDGTAVQINSSSGASTNISTVLGTFYDAAVSTQRPAVAAWGSQYLLIASNNRRNDYWIWDGALLYTRGTTGPTATIHGTGAGYGSTAPTISAFGGKGSGVTATATIDAGGVVRLIITNPGSNYQPGDSVQFRFSGGGADDAGQLSAALVSTTVASAEVTDGGYGYNSTPSVVFSGGGGVNAAATATVTGGVVTAVTMTNAGSSYEYAPTISFSGGTPTLAASARAYLTPVSVIGIAVTQGGTGYTLPPSVSLSGLGGTPPADASTRLTATSVSYVRVDFPGGTEDQTTRTGFYEVQPSVVFYTSGGAGAGATATATVRDGLLESVTVTAGGAGYLVPPRANFEFSTFYPIPLPVTTVFLTGTSIGSVRLKGSGDGYVDAPDVAIDPGFNTAAYASVELMPYGVSGDAIETFQSRVWLAHPKTKNITDPPSGGTILTSSPNSLTDFSISGGGVIFSNTGSVLREQYTALRQINGYLYAIGDSSVDVISNVQTSEDAITSFNVQNVDQEIGTIYRDTVQVFGRTVLFANLQGAFGLYGGAVTRISEKLNNLFPLIVPPTSTGIQPSSASAYINNIKCYLTLVTLDDPFGNANRNVMIAWSEKDWFVATQEVSVTFIATQIVDSDIRAYGTDGSTIFRMFTTPSTTLEKFLVTKQYGAQTFDFLKLAFNVNLHGEDKSAAGSGFTASVIFNCEQTNEALLSADLSDPKTFTEGAADIRAFFLGATIGSTSPDFVIYNMSIGYMNEQGPIASVEGVNAPAAS